MSSRKAAPATKAKPASSRSRSRPKSEAPMHRPQVRHATRAPSGPSPLALSLFCMGAAKSRGLVCDRTFEIPMPFALSDLACNMAGSGWILAACAPGVVRPMCGACARIVLGQDDLRAHLAAYSARAASAN